jgi:hypothetical protein
MAADLRPRCDCQRRARVLWSGPIGPDSRPAVLVCGHKPARCFFRQHIPEWQTRPGVAVTDEVIATLAAEAEAGYGLDRLIPRPRET